MSLYTHARPQSLSPLADSRINDSLLQIIPHFNDALIQRVDVTHIYITRCCTTVDVLDGRV